MNNLISKVSNINNYHLIFLTIGENLSDSNLLYSQVIKIAEFFSIKGDLFKNVRYVGILPLRSFIADNVLPNRRNKKQFIKDLHFKCTMLLTPFGIGSAIRFLSKSLISRMEAYTISKTIAIQDNTIIHCRSYYSTYTAIKLKRMNPHKNIRIVFDMRSLFAQEFPFMMGKLGEILYGSAKEWEWQLLRESDLSLLMQKEARELLKIENPQVKVSEISIIGLDTEYSIGLDDIDFKKRWARKAVSYIGSYGAWHSLHYIVDSLVYFNKAINDSEAIFVTTQPIKGKINKKIKVTSIRHSEIMYFYKDLLALIIPGKKCTNYFDSIQLSANLFSTKAVEALSSGVPLIVNSDIRGLANFVLENKCGILFRMEEHGIKLLNCNVDDLNSYEFWAQMTRNSLEIGSQFRLQKVADKYLQYYKSII